MNHMKKRIDSKKIYQTFRFTMPLAKLNYLIDDFFHNIYNAKMSEKKIDRLFRKYMNTQDISAEFIHSEIIVNNYGV